ncbi:hypothetical protein ABWJ81_004704 [Salmonella enterica]
MMMKYDNKRFNKIISSEVQISADIRISDFRMAGKGANNENEFNKDGL